MTRPARILFTTTTSGVGGAEVFLEDLVGRIDRSRFVPSVLSLCPVGQVGKRMRAAGVPVHSLGLAANATPFGLLRAIVSMARFLRLHPADLVHSQLYRANVVAAVAARLVSPRPVVVHSQHSLYAMTGKSAERIAKIVRPLADVTVAVSPVVRDYLIEKDGVAAERIRVVNNGVDVSRFAPGDEAELRLELGVAQDELLVGTVGRLSEEKGIGFLLEALAAIDPRRPVESEGGGAVMSPGSRGVRLVVIGDGPEREALERRARQLGLEGFVSFLGVRTDIARLLRAMDVFALPSLKEALPISLLEAMACGCCVLASRVGGVPFAVEDGVEGYLVDPGSATQLSSVLAKLVQSAPKRESLGHAARQRVERDFTLEGTARRHEQLYDELLLSRN